MPMNDQELLALKEEIFKALHALNIASGQTTDKETFSILIKEIREMIDILMKKNILPQHTINFLKNLSTLSEQLKELTVKFFATATPIWNKRLFGRIKSFINEISLHSEEKIDNLISIQNAHIHMQLPNIKSSVNEKNSNSIQPEPENISSLIAHYSRIMSNPQLYKDAEGHPPIRENAKLSQEASETSPLLNPSPDVQASKQISEKDNTSNNRKCCVII